MVKKKRQSKRTSLKDKYKVIRKVNEHRRKLRRKERADARNGVKPRMKKDPGIPNLWPFKEELLRKMEATRQRLEERKELAKATRKDLIAERRRMANEKNREIVSVSFFAKRRGKRERERETDSQPMLAPNLFLTSNRASPTTSPAQPNSMSA